MTPGQLAQRLLATEDEVQRRRLLAVHREQVGPALLEAIKARVDEVNLQSPQQALRMAGAALLAAEVADDDLCRALALWTKSHPLMNLERYADGLALCDQALALCERVGDDHAAARVQVSRMWALINLGRFDEALRLSERVRPVLERHGDGLFLARLDMNAGVAHDFADRYVEALAAYERARERFAALDNWMQVARIDMNRAIAYENLERFDEALRIYGEIRDFFQRQGAMLEVARADFNTAVLHFRQGEYGAALQHFQKAYEGFRALNVASEMDQVLLYESDLYLALNLFDEVIERCQSVEARFVSRGIERDVILARWIRALAHGYRGWPGDREKALALLDEVRAALRAKGVPVLAAEIELETAVLLHDMGRHAAALERAQEAAAVFRARDLPVRHARAQLVMAMGHHALGDTERAHELYTVALEAVQAKDLPQLVYPCRHGLGRLAEATGDLEAAHRHYRAAIEGVERIRRRLAVDDLRASFLDDKLDLYADMVLLCLRRGDEEAAFEYAERAKARALVELLTTATTVTRSHGRGARATTLEEELQRLRREWNRLRSRTWSQAVMEERGEFAEALFGAEDEALWQRLRGLEKHILRLERQLQLEDPGRRLLGEGPVCSIAELQRALPADRAVVAYFIAHQRVIAFVVRREGYAVRVLPATAEKLEPVVQEVLIDLPDAGAFDAHAEAWLASVHRRLQRLYDLLVAPLLDALRGCAELVIVPHGLLYYLPFHALHDGTAYLLERFCIAYAPSATVFSFCQQAEPPRTAGGLLLGFSANGQLPQTVAEVQRIAALLPEATVLLEQEATRDGLRRHGPGSRILHIACHATFRSDNPLFSSLRLADGDLTVNEVYDLQLDAALVTLSACETGVSTLKGGDLIGLASGFFYAGARSLVVSLWRVKDEAAARLMEHFYRELRRGASKAAALRSAQLALMRTPAYSAPCHWAPFVLLGDLGTL